MNWAILGLTAGFILVLGFLFYLIIYTKLALMVKFLAVFMVAGFYLIQYESLQQYTGWPATDDLPEKFVLIATEVHEPNQQTGEQGVMYWWISDSDNPQRPPRVYQLPYATEMHKKSEQVIEEQKKGSLYVGSITESSVASSGRDVVFEKVSKAERYQKKNKD